MASEKLLMKSEYISRTTALEKEATKTSPIFSSLSQFLMASTRAILNSRWHWRILGTRWNSVDTFELERMGGLLSSKGFL